MLPNENPIWIRFCFTRTICGHRVSCVGRIHIAIYIHTYTNTCTYIIRFTERGHTHTHALARACVCVRDQTMNTNDAKRKTNGEAEVEVELSRLHRQLETQYEAFEETKNHTVACILFQSCVWTTRGGEHCQGDWIQSVTNAAISAGSWQRVYVDVDIHIQRVLGNTKRTWISEPNGDESVDFCNLRSLRFKFDRKYFLIRFSSLHTWNGIALLRWGQSTPHVRPHGR